MKAVVELNTATSDFAEASRSTAGIRALAQFLGGAPVSSPSPLFGYRPPVERELSAGRWIPLEAALDDLYRNGF
jgi:hypothetical protein